LLRRLHSLSGIFPVGFFLLEHFVSNAFATNGADAYGHQVKLLTSIPFLILVEIAFIYIPIAFHSLYGFYIWYRGESNVGEYPFIGNWGYAMQRWTGAVTFFYMVWHTTTMRFMGIHLVTHPDASFGKVATELHHPWAVAFYAVGILCAVVHFSYGVWLFAAKWGITAGAKGRQRFGVACAGMGILLLVVGYYTLFSFLQPANDQAPAAAEHATLNR
jgi:succinate dehydrogenase / fumarate reductase cytochrome b subunit